MKPDKHFILYACALKRTEYRAALPPRQLAPQGRADVDSQQPRVHLLAYLDILRGKMESPHRTENGKPTRTETRRTHRELWGYLLDCVRTILNMAYPALRWRWLCATLQRADVYGGYRNELHSS